MVCPKCHSSKSHIYNSRPTKRTNQTWRRRRCKNCGFSFSTREYIEADQYTVVSQNGTTEPYSRVKLLLSIAKVCTHLTDQPDIAFHLVGTIENSLLQNSHEQAIATDDIIATTLSVLQNFDTKAYLGYMATYPQLQDARDLAKLLKRQR